MLFDGWASVGRVIVLAGCTYVLLLTALRFVGEEALAKTSAYDLVITIALGSIVATIPLGIGVTLADGLAVVLTYLGLQMATRRLAKRSLRLRRAIKAQPRVLLWDGEMLQDRMRDANVTDEEVRAAVRKSGTASIAEVKAVVLENDGEWSVIGRSDTEDPSALIGLSVPNR